MLPTRRSATSKYNWDFRRVEPPDPTMSNVEFLRRARKADFPKRGDDWLPAGTDGDVVVLGGSALADFRLRVAQSHLRHDLTPSHWSLVGILDGRELLTAPLAPLDPPSLVPSTNGIKRLPLRDFESPRLWPNIGVIHFPAVSREGGRTDVIANAKDLQEQRAVVDLPGLVLSWLAFVWGSGGASNPLLGGVGMPSAAFVETVFGMADVELTPGLASASSCPEAIYQAAKWWRDFYTEVSTSVEGEHGFPYGFFMVREPNATFIEPGKEAEAEAAAAKAATAPAASRASAKPSERRQRGRRQADSQTSA